MREETEISMYLAKIYNIAGPEKAKEHIEHAKEKTKITGLSYKEVLMEEFEILLGGKE